MCQKHRLYKFFGKLFKVVLNSSEYVVNDSNGRSKALHSVIMESKSTCLSKLGKVGVYRAPLKDMKTFYEADNYVVYRAK